MPASEDRDIDIALPSGVRVPGRCRNPETRPILNQQIDRAVAECLGCGMRFQTHIESIAHTTRRA